jgi:microcystin-dependent protein
MKNKNLFLSMLASIFFNLFVTAQTSVTSSGLSIQGIARDENNSAIANYTNLELVFKIYYKATGDVEETILTKTENVITDNFGVFSYVLVIDAEEYNLISSYPAYLRVAQKDVIFSDEKLQSVPYAIHAQNGVPTGSIMPFIGSVAPNGWLLCDGSSFDDNASTANLKALLGSTNTPNLQGLFLRGTGSAGTGKVGPALKTIQEDDVKAHAHEVNLTTNSTGNHSHGITVRTNNLNNVKNDGNNDNIWRGYADGATSAAGNHNHTVTGNTANNGSTTETRPINYGVNYIIKL